MSDLFNDNLSPVEVILHKLGQIEGKLEGITRIGNEILADNVRCAADRADTHKDIGRVKSKQNWIIGVGTGVVGVITTASVLWAKMASAFSLH